MVVAVVSFLFKFDSKNNILLINQLHSRVLSPHYDQIGKRLKVVTGAMYRLHLLGKVVSLHMLRL